MTSLMVIFILLLLAFVNNQASAGRATVAPSLASDIRKQLQLPENDLRIYRDFGNSYVVAVGSPVTFEPGQFRIKTADLDMLRTEFPKLAAIICDDKYRSQIAELTVEGQADSAPYLGSSRESSVAQNLNLGLLRSGAVVRESVMPLITDPHLGRCLAEKVSASGRAEPDPAESPADARRVVFKIKLRSPEAMEALRKAGEVARSQPPVPPRPEVVKVLNLFQQLRTVPASKVAFRLSENEINTYLEYALRTNPRPGLDSLRVRLFPGNYLSCAAGLDLDALNRQGGSKLLGPLYLFQSGEKQIRLDLRFVVNNARLTFTVEKAYYQNVRLPAAFIRQIIRLAAAQQPEHLDTNAPIPLPFQLRQLRTGKGILEGEN